MEERVTPRMHKYGEGKTTRIMTATYTSHHCLSRAYEISGRLISVEQSVLLITQQSVIK